MVNNDDHCAGIILDIMAWLGLFYNVLDISLVIPISTAQFIVVMLIAQVLYEVTGSGVYADWPGPVGNGNRLR